MVDIFLNNIDNILTYIICVCHVACVQFTISFHFREGDQSDIHVLPFPPSTGGKPTWILAVWGGLSSSGVFTLDHGNGSMWLEIDGFCEEL